MNQRNDAGRQLPEASPAVASSVNALNVRLSRLACDVDETIDPLENAHLSQEQADLLSIPILHLTIALRRLEQIVHEVETLDQRPRYERLRAAA